NKRLLQNQFPKELSQVNLEELELVYKQMLQDNDVMAELEQIVNYSIGKMKKAIDSGTAIYELVEQQLHMEPVGILPLYKNEGYLLLRYNHRNEVKAYNYAISLLQNSDANFMALKLDYIDSYTKNFTNSYESIKTQIIRNIRTL